MNYTSPESSSLLAPAATLGPRLLDQVRARIRVKHYSIRTEQAYVDWIKRYIRHFDKRHPRELSAEHLEAFLSHLAVAHRGISTNGRACLSELAKSRRARSTSSELMDTIPLKPRG